MKNQYEIPGIVEVVFAYVTDLTAGGNGKSKMSCKTWCR